MKTERVISDTTFRTRRQRHAPRRVIIRSVVYAASLKIGRRTLCLTNNLSRYGELWCQRRGSNDRFKRLASTSRGITDRGMPDQSMRARAQPSLAKTGRGLTHRDDLSPRGPRDTRDTRAVDPSDPLQGNPSPTTNAPNQRSAPPTDNMDQRLTHQKRVAGGRCMGNSPVESSSARR